MPEAAEPESKGHLNPVSTGTAWSSGDALAGLLRGWLQPVPAGTGRVAPGHPGSGGQAGKPGPRFTRISP